MRSCWRIEQQIEWPTDGQMNKQTDEQTVGQTDECSDGCRTKENVEGSDGSKGSWMNARADGLTDRQMDRHKDGHRNEQINWRTYSTSARLMERQTENLSSSPWRIPIVLDNITKFNYCIININNKCSSVTKALKNICPKRLIRHPLKSLYLKCSRKRFTDGIWVSEKEKGDGCRKGIGYIDRVSCFQVS